jgi:hypothetical protein
MGIRSDFCSPNCYGGGHAAEQKLTFCYSLINKQAACQEVNCLRLTSALLSGKKECAPKFANARRLAIVADLHRISSLARRKTRHARKSDGFRGNRNAATQPVQTRTMVSTSLPAFGRKVFIRSQVSALSAALLDDVLREREIFLPSYEQAAADQTIEFRRAADAGDQTQIVF